MPTTKRLMTDTTGQDIVQAIEDLSIAVKPNATDIHMSSSDSTSVAQKINNEIATVADGIAIVAEGDVHAAIAKGQFVYVRNHSTLAQGVYKATAAIGTNATLSTSNLTLDNAGGLNDLQAQITSLNSKLVKKLDSHNLGNITIGQDETVDVSSVIPAGFKLGLAVPRYPGLDVCCFLLCTVASDTKVKVRIGKWGTGSYTTTSPSVQLLFIPA